jgi:predicted chitinase
MEEVGKGEKHLYGEQIALFSNKKAAFYGRGFIQITWVGNYARMSVILGVDFVNNPELAADPKHAADIMWEGMIRGLFTGKSLADYISEGSVDYKGARRIVNGTDKDDLIAEYAAIFEKALRSVKGDQIAEPVCNRMGCPMKGIK